MFQSDHYWRWRKDTPWQASSVWRSASGPPLTENELAILSVTQRDNEKLEMLTAPNPGPLLIKPIVNISTHQCDSVSRRLIHNHPSGDPSPSQADIQMTREIVNVARPLGIALHDHIIVGRDGHASLKGMTLI
jgi:hypothetical protein